MADENVPWVCRGCRQTHPGDFRFCPRLGHPRDREEGGSGDPVQACGEELEHLLASVRPSKSEGRLLTGGFVVGWAQGIKFAERRRVAEELAGKKDRG